MKKLATSIQSQETAIVQKLSQKAENILNESLAQNNILNYNKKNVKYYVYRIKNIISQNIYFGSTNNPRRRWREHILDLELGRHINQKMRDDFCKFNIDSFRFKILKVFETADEMLAWEQLLISMYYGRSNCCNRDIITNKAKPLTYTIVVAEHKSYKRNKSKKTQGSITKIKGWGDYISIHAASKDLEISKKIIRSIINTSKKTVDGWFFVSKNATINNVSVTPTLMTYQESFVHRFTVGQKLCHAKFGEGTVLGLEGSGADARAQINFPRHGLKWLALAVAKLTPVP